MANLARSANLNGSSTPEDLIPTGVYRRGRTLWIRYHGPRRDGSWRQICESAHTADPEAARQLREARLREVASHREGNHLFRGPYQARAAGTFKG